jgi:hypothetical protein
MSDLDPRCPSAADRIDDARQRAKDEGRPAPLCLTDNMVRSLNRLFGIAPEATEKFIREHPSPFGTGGPPNKSEATK